MAAGGSGEGSGVIVVAEAGDGLVGMAGVFTPTQTKLAHVGMVWGVYVVPEMRGHGIGSRLVAACIGWAREKKMRGLKLAVVEGNDDAKRCYQRLGFVVYGVEPWAVRWQGRYHAEVLMALGL